MNHLARAFFFSTCQYSYEMGLFFNFGFNFVFSRTDAPLLDKIKDLILAAQKLNDINLNPM